jgi:uncharacterized membrane protein
MRRFSVRPAITLKGRKFKGLRGWGGKPFHPPLTDFPIVAYAFAAAFDVISIFGGRAHDYGYEFWHAATYLLVGGVVVSLLAALTGFFDWLRSSEAGTQARRTVNTHATIMIIVSLLAVVDMVLHLSAWSRGARRTAERWSSTTASTSKPRATARYGTSRRPT